MIPDGYRILVVYDSQKEQFVARVPELGELKAEGATRAEALATAEEEVEKAFRRAAEEGKEMPPPIDGTDFTGQITLQITPSLHRELAFLAAQEGVELNQVVSETLSAGLSIKALQRTQKDDRENRGRDARERSHRRPPRGNQYFNIMDDKASFIEYVRGLEGGGGRGGRHGGRGRNK